MLQPLRTAVRPRLAARRAAAVLAPVVVLLAAACGGTDAVAGPGPVASIVFPAESDTIVTGGLKQLTARVLDRSGEVVTGVTTTWRSGDTTLVRVASGGMATAMREGSTLVTATAGGRSASVRVVVAAPPPPPVGAVLPPPVLVQAPAPWASAGDGSFTIRATWVGGGPDARVAGLVDGVLARWQRVVTADLPDIVGNIPANACYDGQPAGRETIDDLLVYVRVVKIDGPSATLARAGPCLVRSGRGLPVAGIVELDEDDLNRDPTVLTNVLMHEFGHVLGIGTLWESRGLLYAKGGDNPIFLGATAQGAYATLGGGSAAFVPIENSGGEGTRDGHWREAVFRTELMTGWINVGANQLSAMTIASLRDFGYQVNLGAADVYTLPVRSAASPRLVGEGGVPVVDEVIRPRYEIDLTGQARRLPPQ